ncbi:hypothetical protein LCGC14_1744770 [marine sediment metagenome]|uniref:Uncharacterized protein n=1 Tax=marine sediment metagenome TaxID=412755 RepID=A0A0F9K577_9ZZZZ
MRELHTRESRVRIAQAVREQLHGLRMGRLGDVGGPSELLLGQLAKVQAGRRKLSLCLSRGWLSAAQKVMQGIESTLRDVPHYVSQVQRAMEACRTSIPTLRDVAEELAQVEDEFDRVTYDPKAGTVSVTTEPIELDGVFLGDFEVRLEVSQLSSGRPETMFRVIARDPHPAATNEAVCHPHVSDERMCCGDATTPIRSALESGRLSGFFMIVRSVLTHYNPGSPYVALENWSGVACHDCGYGVAEDDACYCQCCDRHFCSDCFSYCRRCDEYLCLGCMSECPVCQDPVCESCLTTCPDCDSQLCRTCEDEQQCPCIEEREEQENENEDEDSPVGLGQGSRGSQARTDEAGGTAA